MIMQKLGFPAGIYIGFRILASEKTLASWVHTRARTVELNSFGLDTYVVRDENGAFLGAFPYEFVAAILPLETVGPGAAREENANQQN